MSTEKIEDMQRYLWNVSVINNLIYLDKRKTMAQPIIQQLTVLEEASISMEQSIEIKTGESPTHQSDARAKEINEKYGGDKIPIPQFRRQQTDNNMNRFSINEEVHRIEVESHHD